MKLNSHNLRSDWIPAARKRGTPRSAAVPAQRGIALVITLIMLSVTLVMAVAFLALSRRERNSVSTATDTTTAKLAADSALAAAQAQIMANVLATNVGTYNFGLLVSTNFVNSLGFIQNVSNPTNVNYDYYTNGVGPLSSVDFIQNVANLQFLARAPVFIQTNLGAPLDFRFYLDLNRNGQFDDTGNNLPYILEDGTTNGFYDTEVGDPQWVGILARPDVPHSPNNQFVARYSFIAIPIGNGLDINAIHDQPANQPVDLNYLNHANSAYLRNEGVGSWELNLAAFLADLNTNQWDAIGAGNDYQYREPQGFVNSGAAFDDALSILSHRYNYSYSSLYRLPSLFGFLSVPLQDQPFDLNPTGPLLTGTPAQYYANLPGNFWAGSDNTNRFYDLPSELFNPTESSTNFVDRLLSAGTENGVVNHPPSTYDRYTFYRLLAQMGTDSDPDDGKMNLNFRNITNGVVVPGMETNCLAWSPIEFFTNAADRMLRLYTTNWFADNPAAYLQTYYGLPPGSYSEFYTNANGFIVTNDPNGFGLTNFTLSTSRYLGWTNIVPAFGITNIPVYVNGQFVYSPTVNRVLQLAANLYEASTNELYPSVFRPVFKVDQFTNLFIVGYTNVTGVLLANPASDFQFSQLYDVTQLGSMVNSGFLPTYTPLGINIYGVPWIIGAKKNLPGFDQLSLLNTVQVTRRLQVFRNSANAIYTNHMYELSISNSIGAAFWNSYSNDYDSLGTFSVIFSDNLAMAVSNSATGLVATKSFNNGFNFTTNVWPGSKWPHTIGEVPAANSFIATTYTNTFYSNYVGSSVIYKTGANVFALPTDPDLFESNNVARDLLPAMTLMTTNWMRGIIVDNGHVIDYVQLRGPMDATNFTAAINDPITTTTPYLWSTNTFGGPNGPSWGYVTQIQISEGLANPPPSAIWTHVGYPGNLSSVEAGTLFFKAFFTPSHQFTYQGTVYMNTSSVVQAGYTTTRNIFVPYLYQANDPIVHYLVSDLNAGAGAVWGGDASVTNGLWEQNNGVQLSFPIPVPPTSADILKSRFQPWGANAPTALLSASYNFGNPYNAIYKDPGVWDPDYWNFPTNRYPSVGWIGRVHRGSSWQTVYLKATNVIVPGNVFGTNTWAAWTGNNNLYDAANSAPVQDRLLFDLFTTRPNDNAARGTLSVNQTNLAAWSAALGGVVVLTNTDTFRNVLRAGNHPIPVITNNYEIIQPAGANGYASALANIVATMNSQRASTNAVPIVGFANFDGVRGAFEHVGDILSVPALTVQSPFLNWSNNLQQAYGISDSDYEWLPQQIMGLLRGSSTPRYVIYGYGQTLRPAPNGLVNTFNNFGLVTNYQVVAESAVRAVISVHAHIDISGAYPVTNYTTQVENYNVLPSN